MTTPNPIRTRRPATRRGRWVYGDHEGLNPGWLLRGTSLVLDFDRQDGSGSLAGCYQLWCDGRQGSPIDHYLNESMAYVEEMYPSILLDGTGRGPADQAALRSVARALAANGTAGTVLDLLEIAAGVATRAA